MNGMHGFLNVVAERGTWTLQRPQFPLTKCEPKYDGERRLPTEGTEQRAQVQPEIFTGSSMALSKWCWCTESSIRSVKFDAST